MKLAYQQVTQHLQHSLAPFYLVSSDELLLVQETVDAIRAAARHAGFAERTLITPETGSDFEKFIYSNAHTISLFSTKRIIELNLTHAKLNNTNSKILEEYATKPPADTLLIVYTNKLDSKVEKSKWYQTLEKNGVVITIWPIPADQLPQWIIQRAKKRDLTLTKSAAELLAARVEGNLLAAAQELEKLALLQIGNTLDHHAIEDAVTDNARFDIFNLVDSALMGNSKRCLRILQNLSEEDIEPTIILWALTRELRTLSEIIKQVAQKNSLSNLFNQFRIWEKRQPLVRAFLQRHTQQTCWALLLQAATIDRIIKGAETGNIWDKFDDLALTIAGNGIII